MIRTPQPDPPLIVPMAAVINPGGQHASTQGDSTRDKLDNEDTAERLADFEAAWEEIRYGMVAGREW